MKKHKENTNKKNKKVAAGAALGVAAAAGVAAMASGKDAEADAANDENAADSPAESRLEEAAESAAGQMADDVANVEQVTPDGDNESDVLAANDDAVIDDRNEKIGRKIRDNELKRVPYMVIVGEKEAAEGLVSMRKQGGGEQACRAKRTCRGGCPNGQQQLSGQRRGCLGK